MKSYVKRYYTIERHMNDMFNRLSRKMGLEATSKVDYEKWRSFARIKLNTLLGMEVMEECEGKTELLETVDCGTFHRDKIILQTEPDVWMPIFILIPKGIQKGEKRPTFIVPHGHGGGKYIAAGDTSVPLIRELFEKYPIKEPVFAQQLVNAGYIVFCPDSRGAGERREWMKQSDEYFCGDTHNAINNLAISLGYTLAGMMIWDLMKLLDYIEKREDCDRNRIGCGGMSGGGMQTLYLSAMDDRIQCSVISGYFYGVKESLLELPHNCGCNFIPNLWRYFDMGDLGALISPRPLFVESGEMDPLNGKSGIKNVLSQIEITKTAYGLLHEEEKFVHHIHKGGHEWDGSGVLEFIEKWL